MLSGTVTVPRGQSVGEVVVFHGRAFVAGVVVGDVVVIDGPVMISGQVSGSVVAMNGPIRLGATASVGRDVLGAHGVRLDPGALVGGEVREDVAFTPRGALAVLGGLLGAVAIAVSTLLLALVLLALTPRALDRVATAGRTAPFASIGWGVAISIAVPVLALGGDRFDPRLAARHLAAARRRPHLARWPRARRLRGGAHDRARTSWSHEGAVRRLGCGGRYGVGAIPQRGGLGARVDVRHRRRDRRDLASSRAGSDQRSPPSRVPARTGARFCTHLSAPAPVAEPEPRSTEPAHMAPTAPRD